MNVTHTPTPWANDGYGSLRGADGRQVDVWGLSVAYAQRSPETEGNAAFIVKAVNAHDRLKAALEDMIEWARLVSDEYIDGSDLRKEYLESLKEARAALAAAGEQV